MARAAKEEIWRLGWLMTYGVIQDKKLFSVLCHQPQNPCPVPTYLHVCRARALYCIAFAVTSMCWRAPLATIPI